MRLPVVPAVLAAALVVMPAGPGHAPAFAQDFSITNPEPPAATGRPDVLRQLQAWWDVHAYYPRRASANNEGGTVRVQLVIRPDGNIWRVEVAGSSGSAALDAAAVSAFRGGFVRPLPPGEREFSMDLSLHYVPADQDGRPSPAGAVASSSRRPFTITSGPTRSPILETMLQRTCTGTVVRQGIRNHPAYGVRSWAQAVFFRRTDGTPWVKFYEGGFGTLAPVVEVGQIVKWAGRRESLREGTTRFTEYTVWADNSANLSGNIEVISSAEARANQDINRGGTIDLSCTTETVPPVDWSAAAVTPIAAPLGDPP